jgi:hypothetical protein
MGKQLFHVQRRSVTTTLIDYLVLILKTVRYTECSKIEGTEAFMENLNTTSMRTTRHALFYSFSFIFFSCEIKDYFLLGWRIKLNIEAALRLFGPISALGA